MEQLNHAISIRLQSRVGKTSKIFIPKNLSPSSPRPKKVIELHTPTITRKIALKEYQKVKSEIREIHKARRSASSSSFLSIERKFGCNLDSPSPDRYCPKYSFIKPTTPSLVTLNSQKNTPRKKVEFTPKCLDLENSECSYPSKYTQSKLDADSSKSKIQPPTQNLLSRQFSRIKNRTKESPKTPKKEQKISIFTEENTSISNSPSYKGPDFSKSAGRTGDYFKVNSTFRFYPQKSETVRSYTPDFSNPTSREMPSSKQYSRGTVNYDKCLDACLKLKPRSNISIPSIEKASGRDDRFLFNRGYFGVSRGRYYK